MPRFENTLRDEGSDRASILRNRYSSPQEMAEAYNAGEVDESDIVLRFPDENEQESVFQMIEGSGSNEDTIDALDEKIANLLDGLEGAGLNVAKWNKEYENLPEEAGAFKSFLDKLYKFKDQREDALSSFEFTEDYSEDEKEKIRQFDHEAMSVYRNPDFFLGNGASAEVYSMSSNDALCVKFITDQAMYNLNNHLRVEAQFLSKVYEHTKDGSVRTPHPVFLRIHANEGHSYGMEKINGASLSQLLEHPEKYPEVVAVAKELDQQGLEDELVEFVERMHEAGVVHCDLYKRNLMLDTEGQLFVIDFGKAKQIEFKGGKIEERKSDEYNARNSLRDFFRELEGLTI